MDGSTQLEEDLVAALAGGATILTGNQRAARTLHHRFDLHQRSRSRTSWQPPALLALESWTTSLWRHLVLEGHTTRLLLNRSQEHTLWRAVIAADPELTSLRSADSLAEMAADAWSRLCAYQGEHCLRSAGISADTLAFQRWAQAVERRCRTGNYLLPAQLEAALLPEIAAQHAPLAPAGYVLVGFDGITPQQQALMKAIRAQGVSITEHPLKIITDPAILVAAEDEPDELVTAARWIRSHLEEHPAHQVALIVPDLADRRAELDRTLRNILAPELQNIAASPSAAPFEFSLGIPLASTPLIAAALDLLSWTLQPIPLERLSLLLLSPHFGGRAELNARAAFDAYELRRSRMLRPELSLDATINFVAGSRRNQRMPHLLAALKSMRRVVSTEGFASENQRPAADWAESIQLLLEAAGWTGEDDSIEFQTRRRWERLLDQFTTLDFEGARFTFRDALAAVTRLARETLFAPESRNVPVQVLGPLESAGSTFDALWFLGAGDLAWPPRSGVTPLLSWNLQRELGMPGTAIEQDTDHARRMTERIARSASITVFSYARETASGTQRAAPVLAGLTGSEIASATLLPAAATPTLIPLEDFPDNTTLSPPPDQIIRGGADLLKQQAACGFRAFAEKRLWSSALDTNDPGMDARARGDAVHIALQHIWQELQSQSALKVMPQADRRDLLTRSINTALTKSNTFSSTPWDAAYMDVQRERLLVLLDSWLMKELQRTVPFTVKLSETELRDVHVGPLRLTLRVDRIDETEFGDVILDYKTGAAKPSAWLSDRPDEPQLPLYSILSQAERLAGVAFAQVRAGKDMDLNGYQTQDGILLRSSRYQDASTLEEQVAIWREILTSLAEDFYNGDIRVRPKKYPNTCEYCAQRLLCRLDISLLTPDAGDDADLEAEEASHS